MISPPPILNPHPLQKTPTSFNYRNLQLFKIYVQLLLNIHRLYFHVTREKDLDIFAPMKAMEIGSSKYCGKVIQSWMCGFFLTLLSIDF